MMTEQLLVSLAEVRLKEAKKVVSYRTNLETFDSKNIYEVSPFPKDWQQGYTNVYIGARKAGVSKAKFMKILGTQLGHAKKIFGPPGMRGYLVLSDGNYEIAFMNWPSKEAAKNAGSAAGREAVLAESESILESFGVFEIPSPNMLSIPLNGSAL